MPASNHPNPTVQELAQQLRRFERSLQTARDDARRLSTGIAPLDQLLPEGGISRGSIVEWLSEKTGHGAGTLALTVAGHLLQAEGACVVIDPAATFYPPAAGGLAEHLHRTIVVHPTNAGDALWVLEQSLRCRGVAVVVCRLGQAFERQLHNNAYRRLQLAAEASGAVGMLLRPARCRRHPSWADMRLLVEPLSISDFGFRISDFSQRAFVDNPRSSSTVRHLQLTLLHCRGRTPLQITNGGGRTISLEIDDETGHVRLAAGLAAAADRTGHAAGA